MQVHSHCAHLLDKHLLLQLTLKQHGAGAPTPTQMKNPRITFDCSWPFASTDSTNHRLKSVFLSAVGNLQLGMRKYCFHLLLVESAHVKAMERKGQLLIGKDPPTRGPAQFKSVSFEGQL